MAGSMNDLTSNFRKKLMTPHPNAQATLEAFSQSAAPSAPGPAMTFAQYSPLALRTAKPLPHEQQLMHAELGLVTEVGELADNIKKHVVYGKPFDAVNLMEEVADAFWYGNLWMFEKALGAKFVDNLWERLLPKLSAETKDLTQDPWNLVKITQVLAASSAALCLPAAERGASDEETLEIILGLLLILLHFAGYTMSDALKTNIDKLAKRYGDKYSDYNALNRDTAAERVILEGGNAQAG